MFQSLIFFQYFLFQTFSGAFSGGGGERGHFHPGPAVDGHNGAPCDVYTGLTVLSPGSVLKEPALVTGKLPQKTPAGPSELF